ncbi:MAG: hypothetical protein WBB67_15460, partial [bacterium]
MKSRIDGSYRAGGINIGVPDESGDYNDLITKLLSNRMMLSIEEILRMEMIAAPSHFLLRSINSVSVNHASNNKVRGAGWNGFFEW